MLSLLLNRPNAQFIGTALALVGYTMVIPLLVAGSSLAALVLFLAGVTLLVQL